MLRMFVQMPEVRGFACVPCCYMQLTQRQTDPAEISHPRGHKRTKDKIFEAGATATTLGYPMSQHVQSQKNHILGFNACELACHSLEQYYKKLKGAIMLLFKSYEGIGHVMHVHPKSEFVFPECRQQSRVPKVPLLQSSPGSLHEREGVCSPQCSC